MIYLRYKGNARRRVRGEGLLPRGLEMKVSQKKWEVVRPIANGKCNFSPTLHRLFLLCLLILTITQRGSGIWKRSWNTQETYWVWGTWSKLCRVACMRSIWIFDHCQQLQSLPDGFGFGLKKWILCMLHSPSLTIPNMPFRFGKNPSQDFYIIWWPANWKAETSSYCVGPHEIVIFVGILTISGSST